MAKLGLSSPWTIYYRKLEALFKKDPGVRVVYDEEKKEIKLYVTGERKAAALTELLPAEQRFGRIVLKVTVIPANGADGEWKEWDLSDLFTGNDAVDFVQTTANLPGLDIDYVIFHKEVVQYYTDNLMDYNGLKSTLYEDLARDVFGQINGVSFCTNDVVADKKTGLGIPLGEWP